MSTRMSIIHTTVNHVCPTCGFRFVRKSHQQNIEMTNIVPRLLNKSPDSNCIKCQDVSMDIDSIVCNVDILGDTLPYRVILWKCNDCKNSWRSLHKIHVEESKLKYFLEHLKRTVSCIYCGKTENIEVKFIGIINPKEENIV